MATPADQIADILSKAIAKAIEDEKDTLTKIAEGAKSKDSDNPLGSAGDLFGILFGLIGSIPIIGELFSIPEEAVNAIAGAAGNTGVLFAAGYFLGQVAWQMGQPLMREGVHASEAAFTSQIFDPETAAQLVAQGLITGQFGESEAQGGGFDASHFAVMAQAAINYPDVGTLYQLFNHSLITENQFQIALQRHGYPPDWHPVLQTLARNFLSPADLALATLRGVIDPAVAATYAASLGVTGDDFQTLIENTGEPPGLMQLLEAYRRDFIDEPTLEKGIRQSRVRDEWISVVEALRYTPMSTADAARAVVQNYLTDDQGAAISQQNGLEPDHWQYIVESWGRPLAHGEMMQLYYRGDATLEEVQQALRESDIKDKYINQAVELGVKLPALWQITQLLKDHVLDTDTASTLLLEQGYQPDVVKAIVAGNGGHKIVTAKVLTVSDFIQMYDDGLVDRQGTEENLMSLGYDKTDADWLISIADAKQQATLLRSSISEIRGQYNRRLLSDAEATNALTTLGIAPDQANRLVTEWKAARGVAVKHLTESQIMKVFKDGFISQQDAYNRLSALGYSDVDAELLLLAYGGASVQPGTPGFS